MIEPSELYEMLGMAVPFLLVGIATDLWKAGLMSDCLGAWFVLLSCYLLRDRRERDQ